jgi:hypothetical protein
MMNKLLLSLLLLIPLSISAQNNIYTSGGISQTVGPPTYTPGRLGNVVAIDTATGYWYVTPNRLSGSAWLGFGFPLANISGSVPPAFTPTKFQPRFVINAVDSMYYYNGTAWKHVNKGGSSGITSLNGLTASTQTFATGTTGTDFNIASSTSTHTFNLPTASATNRGALSSSDWSTFNGKVGGSGTATRVAFWSAGSTLSSSSNFYWDNTLNRLGIRTTSPRNSIDAIDNSSGAVFSIQNNSASGYSAFDTYSSDGLLVCGFGWQNGSAGGGAQRNTAYIYINNQPFLIRTGTTTRMYMTSAGLFGFGTAESSNAMVNVRGSNTSSGTNAFLVQNSTPSDLHKIENNGRISYWATNTATGTTGAQTIDRPSGTVNFAAGASALVVTNSLVATTSIVFAVVRTNDSTAYVKNVVAAAGSFTINLGAAATAETSVGFWVIN